MSEENKTYCTQCGAENSAGAKFCSSCGNKLEQPVSNMDEESLSSPDGVFSGESQTPFCEKVTDVQEDQPAPIPGGYQYENRSSASAQPNYYSSDTGVKQGGGNIGFAIASLVCGIMSILCCCLTLFSGVLGLAAIVLGIITLSFKYDGKGMAIAGIATGSFGLVIAAFTLILSLSDGALHYESILDEFMDEMY